MPKLAVFPKGCIDALVVDGSLSLAQWIDMASTLNIQGLEMYSGMLDLQDPSRWGDYKSMAADKGLAIPMLCCSPDYTHPDASFRKLQVDKQKYWIEMATALGGNYCRVLTGQRRPEVSREDGIRYATESILACHDFARDRGVTLIIENHYKDNYWHHPEFAQHMDVFCELLNGIDPLTYPNFAVNYDPSNTLLAGEDPLELLRRVRHRVATMHASDRYLIEGTIDDLRAEEDALGYASRLSHGEIGKGLNDYDAIFTLLKDVGFNGWISIEDGVDGVDQLERSVGYLNRKIREYWPI